MPGVAGDAIMILLPLAIALVVAVLLSRYAQSPGSLLYMVDMPNDRSLHVDPVSRGGGMAVFVAAALALAVAHLLELAGSGFGLSVVAGAVVVAVIGYVDDRGHVPAHWRLLIQCAVVVLVVLDGFWPQNLWLPGAIIALPEPVSVAAACLLILWMINLFNFMDGMDGFAGGMAVFGFATLGLIGWWQGDAQFAITGLVLACSAAGFLIHNFPPAKVFMGDVGSTVLGYAAAVMVLYADRTELIPLWVGLLVFSPFVVDATVTLARRMIRREKIWQAHRSHSYQRLVVAGWGHRKTVMVEYALMAACSASAVAAMVASVPVQWGIAILWLVIYSLLLYGVGLVDSSDRAASQ